MLKSLIAVPVLAAVLTIAACEKEKPAAPAPKTTTPAAKGADSKADSPFAPTLFLTAAPADAKDVKAAKSGLKAGDKVVLLGRIGGSEEPFVEERAMFTLVDQGLKYCGQDNKDDHCKTPWDYCCESADDIAANTATVQVVSADGKPLKTGLNGVRGLKPLAMVAVVGTVATAEGPNLVVNATGIHIAP